MYFRGSEMNDSRGYRQADGFSYEVTIESIPFRYSYDMIAPEMTLQLSIVSNYGNMNSKDSGSEMNGSESDMVVRVVNGSTDEDYSTN